MSILPSCSSQNRPRALPVGLLGVVSALLIIGCGTPDTSSDHLTATNIDNFNGRFVAIYETSGNAAEEGFLRDREVLDQFTETLNDFVRIPRDVRVVAKDCGESNAFYIPDKHVIELCYELSAQERVNFSRAGESEEALETAVYQSVLAALYHEAGHALIAELELPITGREEDVADQMAAYILTSDDESKDYLLTTARSYALAGSQIETYDDTAFSDTHSLDAQRAVNFLCYVYGSDENAFQYLVDDGALNPDRAAGCVNEYTQLATSWEALLAPYLLP